MQLLPQAPGTERQCDAVFLRSRLACAKAIGVRSTCHVARRGELVCALDGCLYAVANALGAAHCSLTHVARDHKRCAAASHIAIIGGTQERDGGTKPPFSTGPHALLACSRV